MDDSGLTAHGRRCLEHLKQVRALGTSVAKYAREHGLKARMLYDAEKQRKKKGVIGDSVLSPPLAASTAADESESSESRFVSVRVEHSNSDPRRFLPVLRVQHVRGHVVEFGTWPPAELLAAALTGGCDAST